MNKSITKIKFNGDKNQIFNIGKVSYPAGIWKDVPKEHIQTIIDCGVDDRFDFEPPIDIRKFSGKAEGTARKKSKKTGDKEDK